MCLVDDLAAERKSAHGTNDRVLLGKGIMRSSWRLGRSMELFQFHAPDGFAIRYTFVELVAAIAMAPKKSKKKVRVDATDEANDVQRRLDEAEAQLREEAKLIDRLTRENQSKQDHMQSMEAAMANELEKHEALMQVFKDRELAQKQEADHCIDVLNSKICALHVRMETCSTLETVNESLQQRVDELRRQLEADTKRHNDEIHAMRVDMFNHKMALEQTFRKSLQELDAQYLKKAFNAMADESKNALVANAKLKDELQMQSIGVENLMHRFKLQAEQYHKMKVENEILEKGSSLRLKEISLLKSLQHDMDRKLVDIQEEFASKERQAQAATAKLVEELKDENKSLRTLYDQTQKRCQKWKARYVALASTNQHVQPQCGSELPTDELAQASADACGDRLSIKGSIDALVRTSQIKLNVEGNVPMTQLDPKELWSASYQRVSGTDGAFMPEMSRCATAPQTTRPSKYDIRLPLKALRHEPAPMKSLVKAHSYKAITRRPGTTLR
ncbi:hypothetical protein H310_05210 [Aphanomyces invadans]|uniref:Uncharacterized protein n=1 Tax=Aphanomyces invadans TaxID=157072 RepID=A0A024UCD1_9STRA|nr:hypothetical protein H310_05210 [Aphanomyces invadans]ETW03860.1 hypothetical protein H310_05210 [Aphanomyces invadans]|eukprot:XP_008868089.1 hypothetical protein H310_05210 [Aphanomyces invadans]